MFPSRVPGRRHGFTMVELIVVIVVLAILAALAIVGYQRVTSQSKLASAEMTLASVGREVQALAAMDDTEISAEHFEASVGDLSAGAPGIQAAAPATGVFAASGRFVAVLGEWEFSGGTRVIHGSLADGSLATALAVPGVGCAYAHTPATGSVITWSERGENLPACTGNAALDPENRPTITAPPTPAWVRVTRNQTTNEWTVEWPPMPGTCDIWVNGALIDPVDCSDGNAPLPPAPGTDEEDDEDGDASTAVEPYVLVVPRPDGATGPGWDGGPGAFVPGGPGASTPAPSDGGSLTIEWNSGSIPSSADRAVLRVTRPDGSSYDIEVDRSSGRYFVSNPPPLATYEIIPFDGDDELDPVPTTKTPTPSPSTPGPTSDEPDEDSGPAVSVNNGTITVTWGAVPNSATAPLTGYRLYRQPQGSSTWDATSRVYDGSELTFVDAGRSPGTWCYRISAYGPGGESALSEPACGSISSSVAPGAPTGLTRNALSSVAARVTWEAPASNGGSPITSYTVTASTGQTCTWTTGPLTCDVLGLTTGSTVTFVVTATNDAGTSQPSAATSPLPMNALFATFNYTGSEQTWVVPSGVTSITIDAYGAAGAGRAAGQWGGLGGRTQVTLSVTPGETLYINVGGSGWNAGWNGGGTGFKRGGGATDVRSGGTALTDRVVVAGGGGGVGNDHGYSMRVGGVGGGLVGGVGGGGTNVSGGGGTESAGGVRGGVGSYWRNVLGTDGSFGVGGNGGSPDGGGGGGGWYGGGGGIDADSGASGSGGGGSSYTHPTRGTGATHTQGARSGDGTITIRF